MRFFLLCCLDLLKLLLNLFDIACRGGAVGSFSLFWISFARNAPNSSDIVWLGHTFLYFRFVLWCIFVVVYGYFSGSFPFTIYFSWQSGLEFTAQML